MPWPALALAAAALGLWPAAAPAATTSLSPRADAYVSSLQPDTNFGSASTLRVDGDPRDTTYLRFDLESLAGSATRATLRLYPRYSSSTGVTVRAVSDTSWGERTVTYRTAPATGAAGPTSGPLTGGQRISLDVTSLIPPDARHLSFALTTASTASKGFSSREVASEAPRLEVESFDPVVAAAGDIACDTTDSSFNGGLGTTSACRQRATSDLLAGAGLAAVLPLGDNQYWSGRLSQYQTVFDPTWGRVKPLERPVPGNHDYQTGGAAGYFDYFNGVGAASGPAGDRGKGYYSFDVGAWHLVALNSNCAEVGGCGAGSPQEQWLRADLAANPRACTLAYWHHPHFSSNPGHADEGQTSAFWRALRAAGADVVLNGHNHYYQRFARQGPDGRADPAGGIRQFTVGTGGASRHSLGAYVAPNHGSRSSTFGVLKLTLHRAGYDWRFTPEAGATYSDSGTDVCDGPYLDKRAPSASPGLTATASAANLVTLTWAPGTDDDGVAGYRVLRDGVEIATTTTPSYVDATVAAGRTYGYAVQAVDAAGRASAPTATQSATTPAGASLAFAPTADANVRSDAASASDGAAAMLVADASPVRHALLKFSVSGLNGRPVTGARLRLYNLDRSGAGGELRRVGDTSWQEGTVTWSSAPAADATPLATLSGAVKEGVWYEVDVSRLVTGDGTYALRLTSASSDSAQYASKDGPPELAPRLVVLTG